MNILDPFAGAGTTGIASLELHRNCTIIEQNTEFIATIKGRVQQWTTLNKMNEDNKN